MKSLSEWIHVDIASTDAFENDGPNIDLVVDNFAAAWGGIAYAELSVVLAHLRYLAMLHQTHHWTAKGDPFWGDHQLFADLYATLVSEIDIVAEKAVGLGSEANVNLQLQVTQLLKLSHDKGLSQTIPQSSELAKSSLIAEINLLKILQAASESMTSNGTSTPGVENMLQQLFDTHEKHVYLLKRRCSAPALGF